MYLPGNIIYFTPFYFSNDIQPKPKYCIILKIQSDNDLVLFCLTTTVDHIPRNYDIEKRHGCIDRTEINFNCYYFKSSQSITKNAWGFPLETYIYGEQLKMLPIRDFQSKYKIENVDYQILGKLEDDELTAIINCMRDSKTVKRKYRRSLGAEI